MPTDDVWAGLGTIVSTILAALSWLWNIGFLQLLFTFLTGSLATYVVQARLQDRVEKRRIARENSALMREIIYGPLFKQMNQIREDLNSFRTSRSEEVKEIMKSHLYFLVVSELRDTIEGFCERVERYAFLELTATGVAEKIVRETSQEMLKPPGPTSNLHIVYRFFVGSNLITGVNLLQALLQNKVPEEIMREKAAGLNDVTIDITVGGLSYPSNEDVHETCRRALQKLNSNSLFVQRETERKRLVSEVEKIIARLSQFITL